MSCEWEREEVCGGVTWVAAHLCSCGEQGAWALCTQHGSLFRHAAAQQLIHCHVCGRSVSALFRELSTGEEKAFIRK